MPFQENARRRRRAPRRSRRRAANPTFVQNQQPFTRKNLVSFGVAATGVGVGLVFADFLDRWIATRRPADSANPAGTANHPWFGANAAAAQRRRPDALRLGGQAAGAVGAMGLGYLVRGRPVIPWLLGGIALGFGANLVKQLIDWWLMPALFQVKEPSEASFANRMYPLEQTAVQDAVAAMFENWGGTPNLASNQLQTPTVVGVLPPTSGQSPIYALGRAANPTSGQHGKVAGCADCWPKQGIPKARCRYTVKQGDDLTALLQATGTSIEIINALNGGRSPTSYWVAGNLVQLPYEACAYLDSGQPGRSAATPVIPSNLTVVEIPNSGGATAGVPEPQPHPEAPVVAQPPPSVENPARRAMLAFGNED